MASKKCLEKVKEMCLLFLLLLEVATAAVSDVSSSKNTTPLTAVQLEAFLSAVEKAELPLIRETIKNKVYRAQLLNGSTWAHLETGNGDTPFHRAARHDRIAVVKLLYASLGSSLIPVKNGANQTAIHEAAANNATQVVDYLLNEEPSLLEIREGTYNRTPLYLAAEFGFLGLVKMMANRGANLFARSSISYGEAMPIHEAARWDHRDVVAFLHSRGCSVGLMEGWWGRTPLHEAAINGSVEMVKMLVERGSDLFSPSAKIDGGLMPIHWAAALGNIDVVKFMLHHAPSLMEEWDHDGDRPIHVATLNNRTELVELLLSLGEDITLHQMSFARTLLHQASSKGYLHLVKRFVGLGANINVRSNKLDCESLPIHLAASKGRFPVVKYFVENYPELLSERDGCGRSIIELVKNSPNETEAEKFIRWLYKQARNY